MKPHMHTYSSVAESRVFRNIKELFSLHSKKTLDVGCAHGEHLIHFGKKSIGITLNNEELKFLKKKKLNAIKINAENINSSDLPHTFDVIFANNIFEHLLSPHKFLVNLKEVSTEKTILILGVPVLPEIEPRLVYLKPFRGALADAHFGFYIRETLCLTVERAGYEIISARPFIFKNRLADKLLSGIAPHIYVVAKQKPYMYSKKKLLEMGNEPQYNALKKIMREHR